MRKGFFLSALFALVIGFTACDDDNESNNKDITVGNQTQLTQNVFADETSGESGVSFATTGAWNSIITETNNSSLESAQSSPDWISITPDGGKEAGNYTIEINLSENFTGADRNATITIICGESKITITISQKATKEDGTKPEEPEDLYGGTGTFINSLYPHQPIIVDGAKQGYGNSIWFYKDGEISDAIYFNLSSITAGTYTFCDYCENPPAKTFYCQKGAYFDGISGWLYYGKGGTLKISISGDTYTISVDMDTYDEFYGSAIYGKITGTYTGYLPVE